MPKNLKQASKSALNKARVESLDSLGSNKADFIMEGELTGIEKVLGQFIERVKTNIEAEGLNVTGKISDLSVEQEQDGSFVVLANPWLIFQDKGVNGAKQKLYNTPFSFKALRPPLQGFKDWIEARNIQTRNTKNQTFKAADKESLAYAIREKVFQEGFKPRNVYSKEIPRLVDDLTRQIADFSVDRIKHKLFNANDIL